jgi:hypothetical protein
MRKRVLANAVLLGLLLASCQSEKPKPQAVKMPIYEGYPDDLIAALHSRQTQMDTAQSTFSFSHYQQMINVSKTWKPREVITVAFKGGSPNLRQQIAATVAPWTEAANVVFDFGYTPSTGEFREWTTADENYKANVRISFDSQGYWSVVGRDSLDRSMAKPNEPSMNFQGFADSLPLHWQATVLHEFGHALGFEHEHQIPESVCQKDFRFDDDPGYVKTQDIYGQFIADDQGRRPGLYTMLGGPPNGWSKDRINFNLKELAFSKDMRLSPFDKLSIMKYYFDQGMFKTPDSQCYNDQNLVLSDEDKKVASEIYPRDSHQMRAVLDEKIRAFSELNSVPQLAPQLRSSYRDNMKSLALEKTKIP